MSKIVQGDVLDALENGDVDTVLHVVNCQGVMGSGIALQIKKRFPRAFEEYKRVEAEEGLNLGDISSDIYDNDVINLHAQKFYGRGKRHLNYGALAECLYNITYVWDTSLIIGVPYLMGCDRAGGDWEVVKEMIDFILKDYELIYYKLN